MDISDCSVSVVSNEEGSVVSLEVISGVMVSIVLSEDVFSVGGNVLISFGEALLLGPFALTEFSQSLNNKFKYIMYT